MKNFKKIAALLAQGGTVLTAAGAAVLVLALMFTACPNGNESGDDDYTPTPVTPGDSVDDFAAEEPELVSDPNIVTVQAGQSATLVFPEDQVITSVVEELPPEGYEASLAYSRSVVGPALNVTNNGGNWSVRPSISIGSVRLRATGPGYDQVIIISVVPAVAFYRVPANLVYPANRDYFSYISYYNDVPDLAGYTMEPTYRLAWRWRNPTENYGASGTNGGIDIIGKGDIDTWVRTTYGFGGWFYDLNGVQRQMTNGVQTSENGVRLTLEPSFVYDNGVPYLEITHKLTNTSSVAVTGQKFGASCDVMLYGNDFAPLKTTSYGALLTDARNGSPATIKLRFVCQNLEGVTDTDTLYLGAWAGGDHLNHIYEDARDAVEDTDSAMGFSYQNITLAAGETKEYVVRFTIIK